MDPKKNLQQVKGDAIPRRKLISYAIDGCRLKIADIAYCLEMHELDAKAIDQHAMQIKAYCEDLAQLEGMLKAK